MEGNELEDLRKRRPHRHHHHHHHHAHHSSDSDSSTRHSQQPLQQQQQQQLHHQLRQEYNKSFSYSKDEEDDDEEEEEEEEVVKENDSSSEDINGKSSHSEGNENHDKESIPIVNTPTPPPLPPPPPSSHPRSSASPGQEKPSFSALLKLNPDDYATAAVHEDNENQPSPEQRDSSSQRFTSPDQSIESNFSPARIFSKTEQVHNPPFISAESISNDDRVFGSPPFEDIISSGVETDGDKSTKSTKSGSKNSDPKANSVAKSSNSVIAKDKGDESGYNVFFNAAKVEKVDDDEDYEIPLDEEKSDDEVQNPKLQIKKSLHENCKKIKDNMCPPSFSWVVGVFLLVSILLPIIVSVVVTSNNSEDLIRNQFIDENAIATSLFFSAIEKRVDMAENMVFEMSSLVSNQICDITTPEKTVKMLHTLLINFGRSTTLQISFSNGTSYLVMDYNGEYSYWTMENNNTEFCQHLTDKTCSEDRGLGRCMEGYSAESMEWYAILNTSVDRENKWSNITYGAYVYYAFSIVTHVNNEFFAVITSHYITEDMHDLVQFPVQDDMIFFIVDLEREILVSSSIPDVEVSYVNATTGNPILYHVSEVKNEFILNADYHVKKRYGNWSSIRSESFFAKSTNKINEEMVISAVRFERKGLSWGIIAIKTANVNVLDTGSCVAIFFIVLFFIVLGLVVSEMLLRPIKTLSKDMKLVSRLNFQPKIFSNEKVPGYFVKEKSRKFSKSVSECSEDEYSACKKCCLGRGACGYCLSWNYNAYGKGEWSPFNEIREMQESFSKFRAGAEALTKYVSPQVILDVIDKIMKKRKMRIKEGGIDPSSSAGGGFVSDVDARPANVAVLYTDLENFTSLSEKIKRSLLIDTLNHWFKEFGEIIQKNGGMIDKFIGDCIMALFGAPRSLEDNELAACKSALEFKKAFQKVNALLKSHNQPPIGYRVGIHSGEVLLGHIGYEDHVNYTVCGLNVEIANMMEQLGKVYRLSPLVTGDVVTESVANEYVCVFLNIEKVENVWVRVYHLVCHVDSASKKIKKIAARFEKIHKLIKNNEIPSARKEIEMSKRDMDFMYYKEALKQLSRSIKRGMNSQTFEQSDHQLYPIINRKK